MQSQCAFWLDLLKIIIQSVLIVVGWIIVHKLTSTRDLEKSRRDTVAASIDKLCDQVNMISEHAVEYHSNDRDIAKEQKLNRILKDLAIRVSSFKDLVNENDCRQVWQLAIKYKQSITGKHFEDEHTSKLISSHEVIENVAEQESLLKVALYDLKHAQLNFSLKK
jgi:hypothetical protein